jgi:SAM-dependent methyltransferase
VAERPTGLAEHVVASEGVPAQVVDLGAGRCGDALWFARQGAAVTALDFVPRAGEKARAMAEEEGIDLTLREVNLLSLRSTLAEGARLAHSQGPRVVIARHLVDATVAAGRTGAWRLCEMALREGGRLYLEFWAGEPRGRHDTHLLAAVPTATVVAELEARGAVIVQREETQVEGAPDKPGRTLARLVAQWQR